MASRRGDPAAAGRERDTREARKSLRQAYLDDERADAAARGVIALFGAPAVVRVDPAAATSQNLGSDLVPLAGRAHERVSRYDVRLCLAEDQLPARAEPAQWVHPLGQSAARAGTNRFPSDPRSMRLRDLLNWERFRDAAVCDAAGMSQSARVGETADYMMSIVTRTAPAEAVASVVPTSAEPVRRKKGKRSRASRLPPPVVPAPGPMPAAVSARSLDRCAAAYGVGTVYAAADIVAMGGAADDATFAVLGGAGSDGGGPSDSDSESVESDGPGGAFPHAEAVTAFFGPSTGRTPRKRHALASGLEPEAVWAALAAGRSLASAAEPPAAKRPSLSPSALLHGAPSAPFPRSSAPTGSGSALLAEARRSLEAFGAEGPSARGRAASLSAAPLSGASPGAGGGGRVTAPRGMPATVARWSAATGRGMGRGDGARGRQLPPGYGWM